MIIPISTQDIKIGDTVTNKKLIDEELGAQMQATRDIVSIGLRERDKAQMSLKWPLTKATVISKIELSEDLRGIIKNELNVKNITITKEDSETSVELDLKLTPELEAEGFAREISRKIQAGRRKAELVKEDNISVKIDSEFNDILESQIEFIKERVGAVSIEIGKPDDNSDFSDDGKIKSKAFSLSFNKI